MTRFETTGYTVVDGVEVDITIEGDEDRGEEVLMDLKERMGCLAAAYDTQTPPDRIEDVSHEFMPIITMDWDSKFGHTEEDADE